MEDSYQTELRGRVISEVAQRTYRLIEDIRIDDQVTAVAQLKAIFEDGAPKIDVHETHYLTQTVYGYFVEGKLHLKPQIARDVISELEKIVNENLSLEDS